MWIVSMNNDWTWNNGGWQDMCKAMLRMSKMVDILYEAYKRWEKEEAERNASSTSLSVNLLHSSSCYHSNEDIKQSFQEDNIELKTILQEKIGKASIATFVACHRGILVIIKVKRSKPSNKGCWIKEASVRRERGGEETTTSTTSHENTF